MEWTLEALRWILDIPKDPAALFFGLVIVFVCVSKLEETCKTTKREIEELLRRVPQNPVSSFPSSGGSIDSCGSDLDSIEHPADSQTGRGDNEAPPVD